MMTSLNGSNFHVADPLCREFTGDRWSSPRLRTSTWLCYQMDMFFALLAFCAGNSPVAGEFPSQRPVTQSFDVFFDLHLNKRLSKQSRRLWFEVPLCSSSHHCNVKLVYSGQTKSISWPMMTWLLTLPGHQFRSITFMLILQNLVPSAHIVNDNQQRISQYVSCYWSGDFCSLKLYIYKLLSMIILERSKSTQSPYSTPFLGPLASLNNPTGHLLAYIYFIWPKLPNWCQLMCITLFKFPVLSSLTQISHDLC